MQRINSVSLHYEGYLQVNCNGIGKTRSGGLCLLWRSNITVYVNSYSLNHKSTIIQEEEYEEKWLFSGIYGWLENTQWQKTSNLMRNQWSSNNQSWIYMGDFNEIMWPSEKVGGSSCSSSDMELFRSTLSDLKVGDLGYHGYKYTWINGRVGTKNIEVRLDRGAANPKWGVFYQNVTTKHLERYKLNHAPIVLTCGRLEETRK